MTNVWLRSDGLTTFLVDVTDLDGSAVTINWQTVAFIRESGPDTAIIHFVGERQPFIPRESYSELQNALLGREASP